MKFTSCSIKSFSPTIYKLLVIIGLSISLAGCQWGDEVVSLTQPNPDDFAALYTDTSFVQLSTVGSDSLVTEHPSRLLVGRFTDPYLGGMLAMPFFQTAIETALSVSDDAVYDSLTLFLKYDGYFYGDTTKPMNVAVHALLDDISLKNAHYNHDTTPYDKDPLGKARFYPTPHPPASSTTKVRPTLRVRLSDVLGKKIFNDAKANLISLNSDWVNLQKGLVVVPSSSDNSVAIGFRADSTFLQLHYHIPQVEGVAKDSAMIKLSNYYYNHVLSDRSKTVLAALPTNYRISLPSAKSGEMSFIQNGSGIMTRVDLPYLREFRDHKYTFANRAYLRITPLKESVTNPFYAPGELHVYLCDKNNSYYTGSTGLPQALTDLAGTVVTGKLINDLVNNQQYYLMDVSQYVAGIIQSDSENSTGLLIRASGVSTSPQFPDYDTEFSKGFDRLVIGSQNNPTDRGVKLELYYTTVKVQ